MPTDGNLIPIFIALFELVQFDIWGVHIFLKMRLEQLENQNPNVYNKTTDRLITAEEENDDVVDEFDSREIFDLIRNITDPEHPLTLEQLHVVQESLIQVDNANNSIFVNFTPTIPHCSMATLIGLSIRVKLLRCLPARFKVRVEVTKGTHNAENSVNKQLADKERVAAALENPHLIQVINQCISNRKRG
ncbi:MIP18 family protein galla-2 isoform X1 [Tribolium castaneum]|nr:PREDICTED: MIP18 family protein CG7949 isoform X2 [Tribolium castaneum]|eukprot:XP_967071.2 PREDICTED: MIP18 family protein CG7949 isoform X2 [Tribolium castaneum]